MNTLLLESADKFSALTNDTQAAALAQDIFGKAGVDLLPLLKSGRAGIAALTAEAAELGITFTQVAADDSAAFEDATNRLGRSFEGLTKTIGVELLPDVTKLVDKFTAGTKALKDFTAEHPMLIKAAAGLSVALTGAGGAVIGLVALGKGLPLVKAGFAALGATGGAVFLAAGAFAAVGAAAFVFRNELAGGLTNALAEIVRSFGWVAGAAGSLADAVGLDGLAGKLQTAKLSAFQSAENFSDMSDVLLDVAPDTSAVATAFSAELVPALQDTVDLNKDLGNELEDVKLTLSELASAFPSTYEVARHQAEVTKDAFSAFNEQIVASGTALAMLGSDISNIPTPPPMPDVFPEDEMNAAFGRWKAVSANIAADQAARTADLKKGLTDATKDVRDAAGKMFDNMFLKGENVFRSIGNLLKGGGLSIGRAIFQDLTAAFGGPILDAFRNFFKATLGEVIKNFGQRIGGAIAGALGGGAGSAVSGAVSGGASAAKGGCRLSGCGCNWRGVGFSAGNRGVCWHAHRRAVPEKQASGDRREHSPDAHHIDGHDERPSPADEGDASVAARDPDGLARGDKRYTWDFVPGVAGCS